MEVSFGSTLKSVSTRARPPMLLAFDVFILARQFMSAPEVVSKTTYGFAPSVAMPSGPLAVAESARPASRHGV